MFTFIIIVIILVFVFGGSGESSSSNQSTPTPPQRKSPSAQNTVSAPKEISRPKQNTTSNTVKSSKPVTGEKVSKTVKECPKCETRNLIVNINSASTCNKCKVNLGYTPNTIIRLSGVTYEGRQGIISKMRVSDKIQMRRDKYNKHDKNAIGVYNAQNQNIGWIPRDKAATLAPSMDSGIEYHATINKILGGNGYNFGLEILVSNDKTIVSSNKPDNYKSKVIHSISDNKYSGAYKSASNWEDEDDYSPVSYNFEDDYNEYGNDYNDDDYGDSEAEIWEHQWEYNQNH